MGLAIAGLFLVMLLGLISIPFGFPGLVIVAIGLIGYELITAGVQFSITALVVVSIIALGSELFDYWLTARMTAQAGASRRGSWGALIGGILGAIIGVPIPIIGSIVGSLVGLFAGAYLAERSNTTTHGHATRIGWAALISRLVSTAIKFAIGIGVLVWVTLVVF